MPDDRPRRITDGYIKTAYKTGTLIKSHCKIAVTSSTSTKTMSLVSIRDIPACSATQMLTSQPVRQFSYNIGQVGPYEVQSVGLKNAYVGNTGDKTIVYHRPSDGHRAVVHAGEGTANRIFVGDLLLSVTQYVPDPRDSGSAELTGTDAAQA